MKTMIYQVSVGKPSKLYEHCIQSVADYCRKYNIDHMVQSTPKLWIKPDPFASNRSAEAVDRVGCLPIFEKENAFDYLLYYDKIAIVDADIYIRNTAPNIFESLEEEYSFGAVVERQMPIVQTYANKLKNYTRMQYSTLKDVDWKWNDVGAEFYNMGLMVMNQSFHKYLDGDSPKQFIQRREFKNFVDGVGPWKWSTDQTLLNYWVKKRRVPTKQMDWRWNALYTAIPNNMITDAHFVHFFLKDRLPDRGENIKQLMVDIRA